MTLTSGQMLQNRYRIVSSLGEGGMGAVYRARDTRLDVPVAIKEMTPQPGLAPHTLAQLRQQFQQEAQILARLNHPHLVRVGDFFEEGDSAYLVMDFAEGESLANRIEREGALPEEQVLIWAEQLLDALAYCHAQGAIHRDVKPQNVIIRPDGRAVLVDFGLVKLWDPHDPRTKTTMRGMGMPEYAPPEQYDIEMGHTDARSDVYGLGATLYHALLNAISPPGDNADCTVSWNAAYLTETYVLQEATDSDFSDATVIYTGAATSHIVASRGIARYYYRIKAHNSWGDSGWSNVQSVDVFWEAEPNEDALTQANGPVVSGLIYYGVFPGAADLKDYFYFDLPAAHTVELWLTNIQAGHNYDLTLRDANTDTVQHSGELGNADEHILTGVLLSGRYYIHVSNASGTGSTQPYHLRVVYQ